MDTVRQGERGGEGEGGVRTRTIRCEMGSWREGAVRPGSPACRSDDRRGGGGGRDGGVCIVQLICVVVWQKSTQPCKH